MHRRFFFILTSVFFFTGTSQAQSLTDATRLAQEPLGTGARAISMGGAAIANANDFSALDWNPAALTLMDFGEINLSLFIKGHNSTASFYRISSDESLTNTDLASFGFASPVLTTRGHLAYGISYDRVQDFNSAYSFSAVNSTSSFLDTKGFVKNEGNRFGLSTADFQSFLDANNLAWALFLTHNADSAHPNLSTPFGKGGLQQSGTVTEEGGMNALRFGAGIDVAENLALGAAVNVFFGRYDSRRVYNEKDVNNIFTAPADTLSPDNFQSAQIIDIRQQSQAGFSLKLGLLASPNEHFRFGFTFETPEIFSVEDRFQRTGSSVFRNGNTHSSTDELTNPDVAALNAITVNNYTVTTPMKFGAGVSFNLSGLTLSGAADFSDQSQLRFSNADVDLSDLNDSARKNLKAVLNWKVGAEYVIKPIGLILRGGYGLDPSPYKDNPSSFGTKNLSAGIGVLLSKSSIAEITYRRTSYRTDHVLYNDMSVSTPKPISVSAVVNADDVVQNQVLLSFSFRF